jgi:hypothetical protein
MLIVVLAVLLGLATPFAASVERDAVPPIAAIVDAHFDRDVLPGAGAVGFPARGRDLARVLRLLTFVAVLVAPAFAAASLTSSSFPRRRRGRSTGPSSLLASGVSRRGPPLVG